VYRSNEAVAAHNELISAKATDQIRILSLLAGANGRWICASAFYAIYLPTFSQRIGELVKEGYAITRGRCDNPAHKHRSSMGAYRT
jgi:hypothetical protein